MSDLPIPRLGLVALGAAAVAACAITGVVTASGSPSDHVGVETAVRMLAVAAPLAVGFFALHRPPFERFGALLILGGGVWFLATLASAGDPALYSAGRLAHWAFEPYLIFLLLAFPTGRLDRRLDRALVWAAVLLVLTLYLPTALLVEQYPVPAPVTSCDAECPANAFRVVGSEPGFVEDLVRPVRELLTVALFALVAGRVAQRLRDASRLTRRALAPVLAVACFRFAAFGLALAGRRIAPDSQILEVSVWLLTLAVPLTAIAFLVGVARWWVFMARSTRRLAARLHASATPEDRRRCLAEAFDDPELEIVYWLGDGEGHWGDEAGRVLERLPVPRGRSVTEISDNGHRVAAIIHDAALVDDRAFIDTATSYALMTFEYDRLSAQTSALLRAMRESRSRIQAAADDERRRIERDLHDGAQQRLVALRIKLELAAERTDNGDADGAEAAAALRRLGADVEDALEEVRSLARGIYPAPLADRGLVEGLRAAALRNVLPTTVFATGVGRHPAEIESAAYFCCLEALQNAAKHADGASGAVIEVSESGALRMEVRDDGAGFDPAAIVGGVGFTSMRDRLAAVSGELEITSSPGQGTRVTATIPLNGTTR